MLITYMYSFPSSAPHKTKSGVSDHSPWQFPKKCSRKCDMPAVEEFHRLAGTILWGLYVSGINGIIWFCIFLIFTEENDLFTRNGTPNSELPVIERHFINFSTPKTSILTVHTLGQWEPCIMTKNVMSTFFRPKLKPCAILNMGIMVCFSWAQKALCTDLANIVNAAASQT